MHFLKNTLFVIIFCISNFNYAQNRSTIKFYQNDKLVPLSKNNEISLKKQAFSLSYFYKKYREESKSYYALQISFLKNKEELAHYKLGTDLNELSNFKKDNGVGNPSNGLYDTMTIGFSFPHYLYYASDIDHNVELIQNLRNDFEARWTINNFVDTYTNAKGKMIKLKEKTLYMVALRDENLNGILDEGELETYTLSFF